MDILTIYGYYFRSIVITRHFVETVVDVTVSHEIKSDLAHFEPESYSLLCFATRARCGHSGNVEFLENATCDRMN